MNLNEIIFQKVISRSLTFVIYCAKSFVSVKETDNLLICYDNKYRQVTCSTF